MGKRMEKVIEGYPEYRVTDKGVVISCQWGKRRILKQTKNHKGYPMVRLGRNKLASVHRLVAIAFIPNPDNKPQVNHIDEDKENNYVDNLEWMTAKENINYGHHNLNMARTLRKNTNKIVASKNDEIFKFDTIAKASETLKLDDGNISKALRGKRKSVGGYVFKYDE